MEGDLQRAVGRNLRTYREQRGRETLPVCAKEHCPGRGKLAAGATMSHKLQQATNLRMKGLDIEFIGEVDLLRLL